VRLVALAVLAAFLSTSIASAGAAARAARACDVRRLTLTLGSYGEAGGQFRQTLTFTNVGPEGCRLSGWPSVEVEAGVSARVRRVVQGSPAAKPYAPVLLERGGAASFNVYGADWDFVQNRRCPLTNRLRVTPPGSGASLDVAVRLPDCPGGFEVAPLIAGRTDRDSWSVVSHGRMESAGGSGSCPAAFAGARDLGTLAFVGGGRLLTLDVAHCRERTLASTAASGPVSWSADGRYIAFGSRTVAAGGGRIARPLPGVGGELVWAPRGHTLAAPTAAGGVLVGGPGVKPRRLLPDGWGAETVAWAPDGKTLAVARSLYLKTPPPYHQEIWLVDVRSGEKRELFRLPKPRVAPPILAGFSPDGRWLLAWEDTFNSASLMADGLPFVAIRVADGTVVPIGGPRGLLVDRDFLSWCNDALAYVVNRGGRQVTEGDSIAFAAPPQWGTTPTPPLGAGQRVSFASPACSPPGTFELAAAAGPTGPDTPFGHERRRIWLLGYTGGNWHPLGSLPPTGESDELPMWSADGRWLAFVRSGPTTRDAQAPGKLYVLDLATSLTGTGRAVGPLADLGTTGNYYGHYGWGDQLAWYTRRAG
jgi:hypothetical protein